MLNVFTLFHLNLAFSSIEEEQRGAVVRQCYTPLLDLIEQYGPIGVEATAYTLSTIADCDPTWLNRLKSLVESGKCELVGSGYAQIIGPLLPAEVVASNLRLGNGYYRQRLGVSPTLALVNEQAYSAGLVGIYLDQGYEALLLDWDNVANFHPHWHPNFRYAPQRARGSDGRDIAVLWTNTVAFQKLQRLAHSDISLDEYLKFLSLQDGPSERVYCLYASDAEIFGFRPGRYRTEEANQGQTEWDRIEDAFAAISRLQNVRALSPSAALHVGAEHSGKILDIQTPAYPVPVKKQRKYNITRWAVTGRDDIAINAACQRIYRALMRKGSQSEADWQELCRLWSSDYRTHITQKRWDGFVRELADMELRLGTEKVRPFPQPKGDSQTERMIEIRTPQIRAVLDRRRGLAIHSAAFAPRFTPTIGGLPHGYFDDIALQADWYTGDCVFEALGEPKITDLEWASTQLERGDNGDVIVHGLIETPQGPIAKVMRFHGKMPRIDFDLEFRWVKDFGRGVLRLGHITLLGEAFDWDSLCYLTNNGGITPERFPLKDQTVEHGTPVSFLVSAACGVGMTEGWFAFADQTQTLRVEVDRELAPLIGLVTHRVTAGKLFCQLMLSALELDDTRKPSPYRMEPRRYQFSIVWLPRT